MKNIEKEENIILEKYNRKYFWEISITNWIDIVKYQLSEEFIEKYQKKLSWGLISIYQVLSETFIEKYQNKVNWYYISKYQTLSLKFIEKYKELLDLDLIPEENIKIKYNRFQLMKIK